MQNFPADVSTDQVLRTTAASAQNQFKLDSLAKQDGIPSLAAAQSFCKPATYRYHYNVVSSTVRSQINCSYQHCLDNLFDPLRMGRCYVI